MSEEPEVKPAANEHDDDSGVVCGDELSAELLYFIEVDDVTCTWSRELEQEALIGCVTDIDPGATLLFGSTPVRPGTWTAGVTTAAEDGASCNVSEPQVLCDGDRFEWTITELPGTFLVEGSVCELPA